MNNKKSLQIIIFLILTIFSIVIVNTKPSKKAEKKLDDSEPLIHDWLKLAFFLFLGVIIGVSFEAKL
jgi:hypothetical protein